MHIHVINIVCFISIEDATLKNQMKYKRMEIESRFTLLILIWMAKQ